MPGGREENASLFDTSVAVQPFPRVPGFPGQARCLQIFSRLLPSSPGGRQRPTPRCTWFQTWSQITSLHCGIKTCAYFASNINAYKSFSDFQNIFVNSSITTQVSVHQQHFKHDWASFTVKHWSLPASCRVELNQLRMRCWAAGVLSVPAHILPQVTCSCWQLLTALKLPRLQKGCSSFPDSSSLCQCPSLRVLCQRAQSESSPENFSMDVLNCSINIWEKRDRRDAFSCPE